MSIPNTKEEIEKMYSMAQDMHIVIACLILQKAESGTDEPLTVTYEQREAFEKLDCVLLEKHKRKRGDGNFDWEFSILSKDQIPN